MQHALEIEDQTSWPPEFANGIAGNRSLLLDFHRERSRIDRIAENDVHARIDRPDNRFERGYRTLVARLEALLLPHRIVAYHCTRLMPREIAAITTSGMRLLSPALIQSRLDQGLADGYLTRTAYDYLRNSESVAANLNNQNGRRTGMIWFCPNRSTLQQASGVYRLFRSWGGEALYAGHEDDGNIAHILSGIGLPCIVKCAVPFSQAEQYHVNFSERFIAQFISDAIPYPEPSAGFDLHTKRDLDPTGVMDIIGFTDPRFRELTGCADWHARHRINPSS